MLLGGSVKGNTLLDNTHIGRRYKFLMKKLLTLYTTVDSSTRGLPGGLRML